MHAQMETQMARKFDPDATGCCHILIYSFWHLYSNNLHTQTNDKE